MGGNKTDILALISNAFSKPCGPVLYSILTVEKLQVRCVVDNGKGALGFGAFVDNVAILESCSSQRGELKIRRLPGERRLKPGNISHIEIGIRRGRQPKRLLEGL